MPRGKSYDVFKRDTLLLDFLRAHKGEENIVTSQEIQEYLQENGYSVNTGVASMVSRIMYERNAPICFSNAKGYYWATSREELEKTIADLESRRNALQEHIEHLKGFML
jgi:arginine repressor